MTFYEHILNTTGYQPKTTFWQDFSIADAFGEKAVRDTYKRAFEEWKTDVVYLTELVLVLNWKIWQLHENNESLARVYDELWREADEWCGENLKGDDAKYYYRTTD
jgi:hypothetical protein